MNKYTIFLMIFSIFSLMACSSLQKDCEYIYPELIEKSNNETLNLSAKYKFDSSGVFLYLDSERLSVDEKDVCPNSNIFHVEIYKDNNLVWNNHFDKIALQQITPVMPLEIGKIHTYEAYAPLKDLPNSEYLVVLMLASKNKHFVKFKIEWKN